MVAIWLPSAASASPAFSPNITVDTRGSGNLTVTGRVLNGRNNTPLAGANVSLSGQNATTSANGSFTFTNLSLASGSALTASGSGMAAQTRQVQASAGTAAFDVGTLRLSPVGSGPAVEWLESDQDAIYLRGWGYSFVARARVDWNGLTPQRVDFYANGTLIHSATGPGPEYQATYLLDTHFIPSLRPDANHIAVVATGIGAGQPGVLQSSPSRRRDLAVVPLPPALANFLADPSNRSTAGSSVSLKFALPGNKPTGLFNLPVLGPLGGQISVAGEFSYNFKSRVWNAELGGRFEGAPGARSAMQLSLGSRDDMRVEIKGIAAGTVTRERGIETSDLGFQVSLAGNYAVASYGLGGFMGPGITGELAQHPIFGDWFRAASVIVWAKPEFDGAGVWRMPEGSFKNFEFTGKLSLEGKWEPGNSIIHAKVYVGGSVSAKFAIPGEFLPELRGTAYAGVEFYLWGLQERPGYRHSFFDVRYPSASANGMLVEPALRGKAAGMVDADTMASVTWQPMERPWRTQGEERFMGEPEASVGQDAGAEPSQPEAFDLFREMGQGAESSGRQKLAGPQARMIVNEPSGPIEAAFPLLENVFPESEPSLAGNGSGLMLLYVRDTGTANPKQFTEVAFSHFDGNDWSVPSAVASDPRGQFNPQVAFDGAGNAVAVFERFKDAAFVGEETADLAAQMEIVSSHWNSGTGTWSPAQPLTDNAFADFSPQLTGPLSNGDLLLTWDQSESNQLIGTGAPGAVTNLRVMTRRWSHATQSWTAPEILLSNVTGERWQSLEVAANKGVFAWTVDIDGNSDDSTDVELFYRLYDVATGTWGAITRHTTDGVADRNVQVVVDAAGNVYAIWVRDGDLVMDVNFAGTPTLVRSESDMLGFEEFAATIGPGGNVVVIWQETTEHGPDAHYRVYDPASATWGKDAFLSQDADLERSFAPVWDAAGNLTLAYNNVQIVRETKSVEVEGGQVVVVENVPQPGRVDLLLAKRRLTKDVVLAPEGLTADGENFLPGDEVTLRAKVRNKGNLAVQNLKVAFYDGDPDAGGVLIATKVVPGWLEAMDEAEVSHIWMVPQPVQARTIHVEVDPDNEVTEADESNNRLALPVNGVDLALEFQSGSVLRDGSARVVVKVRNLSAPESPVCTLKLKAEDTGATLAEISVSQLAPGQSMDIPFDLPQGSHAEGDRAYVLVIDEEELVEDIDRENNEAPFSLNLWIDDDGDGIPRWWELANGMSDDNAEDALLDLDGDGFTALEEFLAGTNPQDVASRLLLSNVQDFDPASGTPWKFTVSWPSVSGRIYRLERSLDLHNWQTVEENLEPTPPLNTIVDEEAPNGGKMFYRVIVQ